MNHEPIAFAEHDVVIYSPRLRHDQRMSVVGEDYCIHVHSDGLWPRSLPNCRHLRSVRDPFALSEMALLTSTRPSSVSADIACYDHRVTALLLRLLELPDATQATALFNAGEQYAQSAYDYVRQHFRELGRLSEVANAIGVSYDHLRHVFRERYGFSLKHWLITSRIDEAKRLLLHSPLPQKEIAALCGFENERYFSTSFHAIVGQTAGHFRKQARSSKPHPLA
jgi:AraC-like DNA-binding protein